jgi:Cys-rich repeat protein
MRQILALVFLLTGSVIAQAQQCTSNNQCSTGQKCTLDKLASTTHCRFLFFGCETSVLEVKSCRVRCTTDAQCGSGQVCRCPENKAPGSCAASKRACYGA